MAIVTKIGSQAARIEIQGAIELIKGLDTMTESLQRSIRRKIINAVSTEIIKQIRQRAPRSRRTGTQDKWSRTTRERRACVRDALARSLDKNPSSKWRKAAKARKNGIIGVTVRHLYADAMNKRSGKPIAPHSHLVEHGHRGVFWGKSTGTVGPHPYFWLGVRAALPQLKSIALNKGRAALETARNKANKIARGGRK